MRITQRLCWAVLASHVSCILVFAQAPQSAPIPAPAPAAPAVAVNAVAATVNGQTIPETAVQRSLQHVPPIKHADSRPQIVNFLIDQALLDQFTLQQKIAVDPKEIDKAIDEMKAEIKKDNKDFTKVFQELMITEAELRQHIAGDIRWGKFAEERASEKVLKELFDSQKYLFDGSTVSARHILITAEADNPKAADQAVAQLQAIKQEISKQVAEGLAKLTPATDNLEREKKRQGLLEDAFSAQAKAKSACPSKSQGGDVGTFAAFDSVGRMTMAEPFSRAAFTLKPFEISEPVKTSFGYHLILVTERKPGREVKFEEVRELVKEHYVAGLHDSIISDARQKATIVINNAGK